MIWRALISQGTLRKLSSSSSPFSHVCRSIASLTSPTYLFLSSPFHQSKFHGRDIDQIFNHSTRISSSRWYAHSVQHRGLSSSSVSPILDSENEEDDTMNDFLSRFAWVMRGKITEAYPDCDKETVDGMLLIIVGKVVSELEKSGLEKMLGEVAVAPSQDLSEDLWKTVWEVSNQVLEHMNKEKRKEKMKLFLQCERVKEMVRFAGEVGIRGELLRELRFKWAKEEMEEKEFYESLERLKKDDEKEELEQKTEAEGVTESVVGDKSSVVTLPTRHGKMKYKIYGLDLSDPKWAEVADKIHDGELITWPQEPKPPTGKCKLVIEKILSLNEADDPSSLLAEWKELLQPTRIDWIALLDKVKEKNYGLYLKVSEIALDEETFQTSASDYSKLIDANAKQRRVRDAERIVNKMNENDIPSDILTIRVLAHMYSKAGDVTRADEAFKSLKRQGLEPDIDLYKSMIMAYVNGGLCSKADDLLREMTARDIRLTEEIYMAVLRAFCQHGDVSGAVRISSSMNFAGLQPNLEWCTLLVEACKIAGKYDEARTNFNYIMNLGLKPDDRCTAIMIAAYEEKNLLDKAVNLLSDLEKIGFEPGVATYSVLVDWLGKLELFDEVEQLLGKIAQLGEAPPFNIQVSLCDMYARAGNERKALQALGVLEAKKEQLGEREFERIINGLIEGKFLKEARRMHGLMEAQGHTASQNTQMKLTGATPRNLQQFGPRRPAV